MKKLLVSSSLGVLAALAAGAASAQSAVTPPNLNQASSIGQGDLMLVWPVTSGGPLSAVPFSVIDDQVKSDLGGSYLQTANNLSDLANLTTTLTNLGLAHTATNTWTSAQVMPGLTLTPGTAAPTSPINGQLWALASGVYGYVNGQQEQLSNPYNIANLPGVDPTGATSSTTAIQAAVETFGVLGGADLNVGCSQLKIDGAGIILDQPNVTIGGCVKAIVAQGAAASTKINCGSVTAAPPGTNRVISCFTAAAAGTGWHDLDFDGQNTMPSGSYIWAIDGGYQASSIYGPRISGSNCGNGYNGLYLRAALNVQLIQDRCVGFNGAQVIYADGSDGVSSVQTLSIISSGFHPSQAQGTTTNTMVLNGDVETVHLSDVDLNFGGCIGILLENTNPSVVSENPGFLQIDGGRGQEDGFCQDLDLQQAGQVLVGLTYMKNEGSAPNVEIGLGFSGQLVMSGTNIRGGGKECIRSWAGNWTAAGVNAVNCSSYNDPDFAFPVVGTTAMSMASATGATQNGDQLTLTGVTGTVTKGQLVQGTNILPWTLIEGQSSGTTGGAGVYTVTTSQNLFSSVAVTLGTNCLIQYSDPYGAAFAWPATNRDLLTISNVAGTSGCNTTSPVITEPVDSTHIATATIGGAGFTTPMATYTASVSGLALFTASIAPASSAITGAIDTSGNLTVTSPSGPVLPGMRVSANGVNGGTLPPGATGYVTSYATIESQTSGTTGGAGVYTLNWSPTTAINAESMTLNYTSITVSAVASGTLTAGCPITQTGSEPSLPAGILLIGENSGTGGAGTYYGSANFTQTSEALQEKSCLHVTALISGTPAVGQYVSGTGVTNGSVLRYQHLGVPNGIGSWEVTQAQTVASETFTANGTLQPANANIRLMAETTNASFVGGSAGRSTDGANKAPYNVVADPGVTNMQVYTNLCGGQIGPYLDLTTDVGSHIQGLCSTSASSALGMSIAGPVTGSSSNLYAFTNAAPYLYGKKIIVSSFTGAFASGTCTGTPAICGTVQLMDNGSAVTGTVGIGTTAGTTVTLSSPAVIDATQTPQLLQWRVQSIVGAPAGLNAQANYVTVAE